MALTDVMREQLILELNTAFFGLMQGIASGMTDDPSTPQDEGKFTTTEVLMLGSQALAMGTSLGMKAKRLSADEWAELMAEWSSRAGLN